MMTHIGKYLMKDGQILDVVSYKDRVLGVILSYNAGKICP